MRSFIQEIVLLAKEHPKYFVWSFAVSAILGILIELLGPRIISDIRRGLNEGTFTSLSVISLVGTVAGLTSLAWQIIHKSASKPRVDVSVELVNKNGTLEEIRVRALNYGRTTEIHRAGFILSNDNTSWSHMFVGLLPHRVRSGGIPYTDTFKVKELVDVLKKERLSLKLVYVENEDQKRFTGKIPSEIVQKIDDLAKL